MIGLYRKFKAAYGKYFTLSGAYGKHTLALLGIVCLNIAVLLILPMFNVALSTMFEVFMTAELSYAMFFSALKDFCIAVVQYVILQMASSHLVEWLGESLAYHKQTDVVTAYYQPGVPYVAQVLGQTKDPKDKVEFAHVPVCDAAKTATRFSRLFNDFMSVCPGGAFNLYTLWKHSPALRFSLFSKIWVLPKYMVIFAVLYVALYNFLLHCLNKPLAVARAIASKQEAVFKNEVHDGVQHAEQISLLNAVGIHLKRSLVVLREKYKATQGFANKEFIAQCFITLNTLTTGVLAMCIIAPALIAKQITTGVGLALLHCFQSTIAMLSWVYNSGADFAKLRASVNALSQYEHAIEEAGAVVKRCMEKVRYEPSLKSKTVVFSKVRVEIPTVMNNVSDAHACKGHDCSHEKNSPLPQVQANQLNQYQSIENYQICAGSRVKIIGPSGVGKTTLQRIMAGIWPFGEDVEITIPFEREEVMYLPQEATFPENSTLWEAICYPKEPVSLTPEKKKQVTEWMNTIGLQKYTNSLNQNAAWPTILSGGEAQRVRMLSILLHSPKLVFMDESLSGLDAKTYSDISQLLNDEPSLKETTFICIVHDPVKDNSEDFYKNGFESWDLSGQSQKKTA